MGITIKVTARDGDERTVEAREGASLMEILRAGDFDVLGTCGGMCSCGSCHVYASEALLALVPAPSEDEQDMLDALADVVEVKPCSRLSCQLIVTPALDGMSVEVAPQL